MFDFDFDTQGSVALLRGNTDDARDHMETVYDGALRFGGAVALDMGYVACNVESLLRDGFSVAINGQEVELRGV